MKAPARPPSVSALLQDPKRAAKLHQIATVSLISSLREDYPHWDKLRHLTPPVGLTSEDWWLGLKLGRAGSLRPITLTAKDGTFFQFSVPEVVQSELHKLDVGAGQTMSGPDSITNPQTRDRYLVRSLMEEAITSSQLEGAVTTREVAKDMIRTGREPRDNSERMILNNFVTMRHIQDIKAESLTPELVFALHRLVTEGTLDDATAAGRFRRQDEHRVVGDAYGEIFHEPPSAGELPTRLQAMCDFANCKTPGYFVHPTVRAIILHFWLAYDHPFVDGNGRTARALFYWTMLHHGYWLFEFISISHILRQAPIKYYRSFLDTESDDNDLTYFLVAQTRVISSSIEALHRYLDHKAEEFRELSRQVRALKLFNHRQAEVIRHALKHPGEQYTIASHRQTHQVVYQTARSDLLDLARRGILTKKARGKLLVFSVPSDLDLRLRRLEKKT